jgi:GDP-mannose 6-dehydrogenase
MRASIEEVLEHAEVLIVGNKAEEFRDITTRIRNDQTLIDLVRLFEERTTDGSYQGICW